jgi:hypothetical protein
MAWPVSPDYFEAVQTPMSFADPDLRGGEIVTNALGLPVARTGNFADVYEVRGPRGECWAVKCFTRPVAGLRERYTALAHHLGRARLPFLVDFVYLEEGIRVAGAWFPVLKMQWVEGLVLNDFLRDNLDKPALLQALGEIWVRLGRRMGDAVLAHGDLQHGNVMLVPGSKATSLALKLVDYDGMWVPALAGRKSGEMGHPSYQHPGRPAEDLGAVTDHFPLLLIACALRCLLVGGPALWQRWDTGDNCLFRTADLQAPAQSGLFHELWRTEDAQAHALVGHLVLSLGAPPDLTPPLEGLLTGGGGVRWSWDLERRAAAALGAPTILAAAPPVAPVAPAPPVAAPPVVPEAAFRFEPEEPRVRSRRRASSGSAVWVLLGVAFFVALTLAVAFWPR